MKKNYLNAKWIATNKKETSLNQDIESKFIFISSTFLLRISLFKRIINSVQLLSRVRLFATPWSSARQASLSITNSRSSLRLASIESVMPSSHLILCRPLLLLPPIPPSIRVFSNESTLRMRWPKYWRFSFSIIPSKEIPGLICKNYSYIISNIISTSKWHQCDRILFRGEYLWLPAYVTLKTCLETSQTDGSLALPTDRQHERAAGGLLWSSLPPLPPLVTKIDFTFFFFTPPVLII